MKCKMEKRVDLDIIRCLAIINVMAVHQLSYVGFYQLKNPSLPLEVGHIVRCEFITCVPLFLMLTGYLNGKKIYTLDKH